MKWELVAEELDDYLLFADSAEDLASHFVDVHGLPPFTYAASAAVDAWRNGIDYCPRCWAGAGR